MPLWCWKPETRAALAGAEQQLEAILPLALIATSWISLSSKAEVVVSGVKIPLPQNHASGNDIWLQVLEWQAHQISPEVLRFMLLDELPSAKGFSMNDRVKIPDDFTGIFAELAAILLADIPAIAPTTQAHFLSVNLPYHYRFYAHGIIAGLRMHGNAEAGFWIGLETPTGRSISFWWSPQPQMPTHWITAKMDQPTQAFLHLALCCVLRDLASSNAPGSPMTGADGEDCPSGTGFWAAPVQVYFSDLAPEELNALMNIKGASASDYAKKLYSLAAKYSASENKQVGQTCLTCLMRVMDILDIGF